MKRDMKEKNDIAKLKKRYARLVARLAKTGPILKGTITERFITKQQDGHRHSIGPYYQWTFKRHGKTVTVNLSASQSKRFQKAIDNGKVIEEILKEMREVSRQILEATTKGVTRRKPREQKT